MGGSKDDERYQVLLLHEFQTLVPILRAVHDDMQSYDGCMYGGMPEPLQQQLSLVMANAAAHRSCFGDIDWTYKWLKYRPEVSCGLLLL